MSYEEPTTEEKVEGLMVLIAFVVVAVGVGLATGSGGLGMAVFGVEVLWFMFRR